MKLLPYFFVLGLFLGLSTTSLSQDLVVQTNVDLSAFYDDKFIILEEDSAVNAIQYIPTMKFLYDGRRYHSDFTVAASYQELINSNLLARKNVTAEWDQYWNWSRSTAGLAADYSQRFVDEILELDDTVVTSGAQVQIVTVTPYYSARLSERNSFGFSYSYTFDRLKQSFNDVNAERSGDNEQHETSVSFERVMSTLSVLGLYGHYNFFTDDVDNSIEVYGLALGGSRQLSESWALSGHIGGSTVTSESGVSTGGSVADGDTVLASSIELAYSGVRNSLGVAADVGTNQQLDGVVEVQTTTSLFWNRQLSSDWTTRLKGSFLTGDRRGRQNYFFESQVEWRQSARVLYRLGYRFRQQLADADEVNGSDALSAESNRVTLSVNYTFQDMRFDL